MKKLKVIQVGINHEHAAGKFRTLISLPELIEVAGVVDDQTFGSMPPLSFSREEELYLNYPKMSLDEALARRDIDFVCIEVVNPDLVPVATKFALRGIPMHMDKPAGTDFGEYRKLLDICREKNLPFQIGYMFRGNPALNCARSLVQSGVLGNVYSLYMDMNHGYGGEEYARYLGNFPGGIMYNLGCHVIDYIVSVLGEPLDVISILNSTAEVDEKIKNNTFAALVYQHAIAQVQVCSQHKYRNVAHRKLRIEGSNGYLEILPIERSDGRDLELVLGLAEARGIYRAGEQTLSFAPPADRYREQIMELADCIREGKAPHYSFKHDLAVHRAILAAAGVIDYRKGVKI